MQECESSDLTSYTLEFDITTHCSVENLCTSCCLSWLYSVENILSLMPSVLLGLYNCVGLNAASLSGQKCYVVFIAEAGALLYFAI